MKRRSVRIAILAILSIFLCLSLTGCMRSVQLKDRGIVQAIGIDTQDSEFVLTLQMYHPEETGDGVPGLTAKNLKILECKGKTIVDALRTAAFEYGKELFFGSNNLIVIGNETARTGMKDTLNFFNTHHEIQPRSVILLSETSAADIVGGKDSTIIPAKDMENLLVRSNFSGERISDRFMDVVKALVTNGSDAFMPVVRRSGDQIIEITGMGILRDDKLVDTLTKQESRGLGWIQDGLERTMMLIDDPSLGKISVQVDDSSSKIKSSIVNGIPHFEITIKTSGSVSEVVRESGGGLKISEIDEVEQLQEEQIAQEAMSAINKAVKKNGSDIFSFSQYLAKYQPEYWETHSQLWSKQMKDSVFSIHADCTINRTGLQAQYTA